MFTFYLSINLVIFLMIVVRLHSASYGLLRSHICNPIFWLALFQLINAILFFWYRNDGWIWHPRITFYAPTEDRLDAFGVFTLFNISLSLGITLFGLRIGAKRIYERKHVEIKIGKVVSGIIFWVSSIFSIFILVFILKIRSLNDIQGVTADRFNVFGESSLFLYATMLVRSSFVMFLFFRSLNGAESILGIVLTCVIMLSTGVRLNLFSVVVAIGVVATFRGMRISMLFGVLALPVLGFASLVSRFFLRAFSHVDSLGALADVRGGVLNIIINPMEFHYYQSMVSLITLKLNDSISRFPGQELLQAIILPIPRYVFPLKGDTASIEYSKIVNPEVWQHFQSQATLGVFGVTYLEMGVVLGVLFVFLTGRWYARLTDISVTRADHLGALILFNLLVGAVIYTRSGVAQFGQLFWPSVVVAILFSVLRKIRFGSKTVREP